MRFYEELAQREIARRLRIPKATVNSRLTRALARLRGRLDSVHQGDRRAWVRALAPVALRCAAGSKLLVGLWIMKNSHVVAAAGLVALLGSATWILTASAGPDAPPEPGAQSTPIAVNVQRTADLQPGVEAPETPSP